MINAKTESFCDGGEGVETNEGAGGTTRKQSPVLLPECNSVSEDRSQVRSATDIEAMNSLPSKGGVPKPGLMNDEMQPSGDGQRLQVEKQKAGG